MYWTRGEIAHVKNETQAYIARHNGSQRRSHRLAGLIGESEWTAGLGGEG